MELTVAENIVILVCGLILLCICVGYLVVLVLDRRGARIAREKLRRAAGVEQDDTNAFACSGVSAKVLNYIVKVTKSLEFSADGKSLVGRFVKKKDLSYKVAELARLAALPTNFDNVVLREVQVRLALIIGGVLLLVGVVLSNLAGFIGFIAGWVVGISLPVHSMKTEVKVKTELVEAELPEMLEVLSLCLRSGLSFERSLSLYIKHFTNELSRAFDLAINKWNSGIMTREEALKEVSSKYECAQLKRVIDNVIRSLRFGTALASGLEEAAVEARNSYKAKKEELVAKAPVKMMIPTGTLILPAMLLLVLGPVLLELVGGF